MVFQNDFGGGGSGGDEWQSMLLLYMKPYFKALLIPHPEDPPTGLLVLQSFTTMFWSHRSSGSTLGLSAWKVLYPEALTTKVSSKGTFTTTEKKTVFLLPGVLCFYLTTT